MARISINEMTTYRWTFEEDVQNYAAAGISAISVWRQKLSDYGEEKGAQLLAEYDLAVASVLWGGGFTGSDGRSHRESIDDAKDGLRLAAALKAPSLILYSGPRAGHTHNHARRLLRTALHELCALARELDVVLAIEPMHHGCAAEWTFLTDLDESRAILDDVACSHLRIVFDTYHFGHDPQILSKLEALAKDIAIVHLGDGKQPPDGDQNRCRLGHGTIPLQAIVSTLCGAGYEGYFDIELIGEEIESANYRDLVAESKRVTECLFA